MFKLDFKKAEEPEIKLPTSAGSSKKQENSRITSTSFSLTMQAKLQQYMNCELPDVHAGLRKDRGTRDQITNILWIIEKAREFQKNIHFCFIDYANAFDCGSQ